MTDRTEVSRFDSNNYDAHIRELIVLGQAFEWLFDALGESGLTSMPTNLRQQAEIFTAESKVHRIRNELVDAEMQAAVLVQRYGTAGSTES